MPKTYFLKIFSGLGIFLTSIWWSVAASDLTFFQESPAQVSPPIYMVYFFERGVFFLFCAFLIFMVV